MHPVFPLVMCALAIAVATSLIFAVNSFLKFREDVLTWQGSAEARLVRAWEKMQDDVGAVEAVAREAREHAERMQLALERQASELRQHRLQQPPPRLFASVRGQTSPGWEDDLHATQVRQSSPPPLPAFNRPEYMARD